MYLFSLILLYCTFRALLNVFIYVKKLFSLAYVQQWTSFNWNDNDNDISKVYRYERKEEEKKKDISFGYIDLGT